jgi:hypothetical protein
MLTDFPRRSLCANGGSVQVDINDPAEGIN